MLITEALHLLLLRPDGAPASRTVRRNYAAVAALAADLEAAGRIRLSDDANPRIEVVSQEPTGDAVLDAALPSFVKGAGKPLSRLIPRPKADPTRNVAAQLVDAGILRRGEPGPLGGLRTPIADERAVQQRRAQLGDVLAGRSEPTPEDAVLLALLAELPATHLALPAETAGVPRRQLRERIRALAPDVRAAVALRRALRDQVAAV